MSKTNREIDPHHQRTQGALRLFGPALVVIGVILMAIGLISFFSSFGTFQPPRFFWAAMIGLPLIAIGLGITRLGYLGADFRYFSGEVSPVATDTFNTDGRGGSIRVGDHGPRRGPRTLDRDGDESPSGRANRRLCPVRCAEPRGRQVLQPVRQALKGSTCADCGAASLTDRGSATSAAKAIG